MGTQIQHFFDAQTWTLTYVVHDAKTKVGIVIDSVMDFDPKSGRTSDTSCAQVAKYIDSEGLRVPYVLDTHAHADHLSGMAYFKSRYRSQTVIGSSITQVQSSVRNAFNLGSDFPTDGSQFDVLLGDGEILEVGSLAVEALHTPGHTPACLTYRIGDAMFVGDTIFMPDYGTARCDFPGGSADILYESVQRLYNLPAETRVFVCHDYQPGGRPLEYASTIGEERETNIQLKADTPQDEFIAFRSARDTALEMPAPDPSFPPGERPRRAPAGSGAERHVLSQDSSKSILILFKALENAA